MGESKNYSGYILPIAGAVLLFGVAGKFGLIPTGEGLRAKRNADNLLNELKISPAYISALKQAELKRRGLKVGRFTEERFSDREVKSIAAAIRATRGGIRPDDEQGLYSILRRVPYRTALAQLDGYFYSVYKVDLPNFWRGYLNDSELSQVYSIIQKMPLGLKFVS